jgi:hypothetical protein
MTVYNSNGRQAPEAVPDQVAQVKVLAQEQVAQARETFNEKTSRLRDVVVERGEPLLKRARALIEARPKEVIGGLLLASYIAGKLLRGKRHD